MTLQNAIVITGGIACGKSTACSLLKCYGHSIIDADNIAHDVLEKEQERVVAAFGSEIVEHGAINRKKLGNIVFGNPRKRQILESILHPQIQESIMESALTLENKGAYFVDIPLFFESNAREKIYDIRRVLFMYVPKECQIVRLIQRDKISRESAIARIESQMDIESKKALALREYKTRIVDNSSDLAHLQSQVETFLHDLESGVF